MRSRIVSVFSDALANSQRTGDAKVAARFTELGEALLPLINPTLSEKHGLELTSFVVENVSVPPEVEQAIDKGASMRAVGNLNDYVKYQIAQGFEKGSAGTAGVGAELAVGMSVAQQIMTQPSGPDAMPPLTDVLDPGAGRRHPRRRGDRRHRDSGKGRPEGQEDRQRVARHPGRRRSVPGIVIRPDLVQPSMSAVIAMLSAAEQSKSCFDQSGRRVRAARRFEGLHQRSEIALDRAEPPRLLTRRMPAGPLPRPAAAR